MSRRDTIVYGLSATGHHWKGGTEEKSILDAHKRLQSFKAQLDEEKTQYRK